MKRKQEERKQNATSLYLYGWRANEKINKHRARGRIIGNRGYRLRMRGGRGSSYGASNVLAGAARCGYHRGGWRPGIEAQWRGWRRKATAIVAATSEMLTAMSAISCGGIKRGEKWLCGVARGIAWRSAYRRRSAHQKRRINAMTAQRGAAPAWRGCGNGEICAFQHHRQQ